MKSVLFALLCFLVHVSRAQQELHIHQINIENGDATLIGIFDTSSNKYTSKILIDGGQLGPEEKLLPYLKKILGTSASSLHFNYVILTHYHDDHYNGLLGIEDGLITADSIIDPGGYTVSTYFKHSAPAGTKPASMSKAIPWLNAMKKASRHQPEPYVKGRSKLVIQYGTNASTSIGNSITIGRLGSKDVQLRCIAGWGNTLSENDAIDPNPKPSKTSANNFTLAFILSCGQFRYFIGGDMGGKNGSYINQESSVTKFLKSEYPRSISLSDNHSIEGHLCGFKANHHGSSESNIASFMEGMSPAVVMTSAGSHGSWKLPSVTYLNRLSNVKPLTEDTSPSAGTSNIGVYFTNLYDFSSTASSKATALNLFRNKPGVSFHYGNETTKKLSYMIKVTDSSLNTTSSFEVGTMDISKQNPYDRLSRFNCHKK